MRNDLALLAFFAGAALLAAAGGASAQQGVGSIVTAQMFEDMLSHRRDSGCEGAFYTYDSFIKAANAFPDFGNTGDDETRRRELAAFFGQTSQETNGGTPGGPFTWGYCWVKERNNPPTDPTYYGRGPIQLTHQYNYDLAGKALQMDLVSNPDAVSSDPEVAFKTAIWFWMTPQNAKPSCHAVVTGNWAPSDDDRDLGRLPGYGMATNIINGGLECGTGQQSTGDANRVGYYQRYCQMLGAQPGDNLTCENMKPYGP